ncbi:protein distal antenna [Anopheles darlingi]|uniref:protein distal antenna n=1 Tax=Anopheles darlingi TaxID=43151 RepID=UPI0021004F2D|nr:protein distal antenna [Anopheles darlingi]
MMMMATATKGKRPLRHLTATDKIDAIQRIHDGESKASVARDIGVPESTLRGWCKNEEKLRYMSRQSVENAEKLSNEATAAALTAAAAELFSGGPPEKRLKLDSSMFGGHGGKLKYDDSSYYKVSPSTRGGTLNGLDLSGGNGGGGGGGIDKTSGGDIIMNGLTGTAADFSQFAKTAAEISALSKSSKAAAAAAAAYGADLSKHHHHGGDPSKSDHHLSMAAISPLTSLSHLSGMSGLGQSPLALSFNEIATNLNLIAQLNNNHNLATMSSLAGGLNSAAAAAVAAQSLRSVRPKGSNTSATPASSSNNNNNGSTGPSLTVRNLAKLQQQKSSSGEQQHQQQSFGNGRDPNAPVDDALWYWLKSQQAMLGLNNLYSSLPRAASNSPPTPPPPSSHNATTTAAAAAANAHLLTASSGASPTQLPPSAHTPPPPLGSVPLVSTPQPTPPSSAPSLTPEDTKNSSWFWQWYKTFGASLMPGGGGGGATAGTAGTVDSKMLAALQNQHSINNNSLSQQNNNQKAAAAAASLAAYENILYSQLTKGSSAAGGNNGSNSGGGGGTGGASDTLNNNHHALGLPHLRGGVAMDLNMSGSVGGGDVKPEDLSNHHHGSGSERTKEGGPLALGNGDLERHARYNPSPCSTASSLRSGHRTLPAVDQDQDDSLVDDEADVERKDRLEMATEERQAGEHLDGSETNRENDDSSLQETRDDHRRVRRRRRDSEEAEEDGQDLEEKRAACVEDGVQEDADEDEEEELTKEHSVVATANAKQVLDGLLFSSNSNDRCSTTPLSLPRGRSASPLTAGGSIHNDEEQHGGEELDRDVKGSDLESDDSNVQPPTMLTTTTTPPPETSTVVASVAVADIRNSADAVEHGEKFLKWLEACSDPNVTAMQVMQFKYLLNSIKLSAERQLQSATNAAGAIGGTVQEERTRIRKRK